MNIVDRVMEEVRSHIASWSLSFQSETIFLLRWDIWIGFSFTTTIVTHRKHWRFRSLSTTATLPEHCDAVGQVLRLVYQGLMRTEKKKTRQRNYQSSLS